MKIIKYLPDMLIIVGICLLSYNLFRPSSDTDIVMDHYGVSKHYAVEKSISITLIATGLDIAIRKYLKSKENKTS